MCGRSCEMNVYCSVDRIIPVYLKCHYPGGDRAFYRYGHSGVLGRFRYNLHGHVVRPCARATKNLARASSLSGFSEKNQEGRRCPYAKFDAFSLACV
jgi:hypothetical protein